MVDLSVASVRVTEEIITYPPILTTDQYPESTPTTSRTLTFLINESPKTRDLYTNQLAFITMGADRDSAGFLERTPAEVDSTLSFIIKDNTATIDPITINFGRRIFPNIIVGTVLADRTSRDPLPTALETAILIKDGQNVATYKDAVTETIEIVTTSNTDSVLNTGGISTTVFPESTTFIPISEDYNYVISTVPAWSQPPVWSFTEEPVSIITQGNYFSSTETLSLLPGTLELTLGFTGEIVTGSTSVTSGFSSMFLLNDSGSRVLDNSESSPGEYSWSIDSTTTASNGDGFLLSANDLNAARFFRVQFDVREISRDTVPTIFSLIINPNTSGPLASGSSWSADGRAFLNYNYSGTASGLSTGTVSNVDDSLTVTDTDNTTFFNTGSPSNPLNKVMYVHDRNLSTHSFYINDILYRTENSGISSFGANGVEVVLGRAWETDVGTNGIEAYIDNLEITVTNSFGGGDPNFDDVTLLLKTNGSITDESNFNQTFTLNGNVSQSSSQSKYAAKSIAFDGTGDYITVTDKVLAPNDASFSGVLALVNATEAGTAYQDFGPDVRPLATERGTITFTNVGTKYHDYSLSLSSNSYITGDFGVPFPDRSFDTDDFTIEGWVKPDDITTTQVLVSTQNSTSSTTGISVQINGSTIGYRVGSSNVVNSVPSGGQLLNVGQWNHFALIRTQNSIKTWVNGNMSANGTTGRFTNYTDNTFSIGDNNGTVSIPFQGGEFEDIRVTKGIARYGIDGNNNQLDNAFTPPTEKFPTATGDFTLEAWVYFNNLSGSANESLFELGNLWFYWDFDSKMFAINGEQSNAKNLSSQKNAPLFFEKTPTLSINTWYHVAFVRQGRAIECFVDGVSAGVDYTDAVESLYGNLEIGRKNPNTPVYDNFNGYMEDVRFSTIARYPIISADWSSLNVNGITHPGDASSPPINSGSESFGSCLASNKKYFAASLPGEDTYGTNDNVGRVDVFDAATQTRLYSILNPVASTDPNFASNSFGGSQYYQASKMLAMGQSKFLVITDAYYGSSTGIVYIYDQTNGNLLQTINAPDSSSLFGGSVAIYEDDVVGDTLVVGAWLYNSKGRVYVYKNNSASGASFSKLTPDLDPVTSAQNGLRFGQDVAVNSEVIVVGEPERSITNNFDGRVTIYDTATRSVKHTIDGPNGSRFGRSVGVNRKYAIIGAPEYNWSVSQDGRVYLVNLVTGNIDYTYTGQTSESLGFGVAIGDTHAVMGAPGTNGGGTNGKFYLIDLDTGIQSSAFVDPDTGSNNAFGRNMSICETYLVAGAQRYSDPSKGVSGKVHYYEPTTPPGGFSFTAPTSPFLTQASTGTGTEVFLDNFNGTDADTTTRTDLIGNLDLAFFSGAELDTSNSKWGTASVYFPGASGNKLKSEGTSNPSVTGWGAGDFTIEGWVFMPTSVLSDNTYRHIFAWTDSSNANIGLSILKWRSGISNSVIIYYGTARAGDWGANPGLAGGTLPDNQWFHLCLMRSAGTMYYFYDGSLISTKADSTDYSSYNMVLTLGNDDDVLYNTPWSGWFDDFRISDSAVYSTSGFTAPTSEFGVGIGSPLLDTVTGISTGGTKLERTWDNGELQNARFLPTDIQEEAWESLSYLPNPAPSTEQAYFGNTVSASGNYLLITERWYGGVASSGRIGRAHLYNITNGQTVQTISNPHGTPVSDEFGNDGDIDGNYLVVAAYQTESANAIYGAGRVYIYSTSLGDWSDISLDYTLTNPQENLQSNVADQFGYTISLKGNYLAVAEPNEEFAAPNPEQVGRVFIYDVTTGQQKKAIFPPTEIANMNFGEGLALGTNYLAIYSKETVSSVSQPGTVRVYSTSIGDWTDATLAYTLNENPLVAGASFGRFMDVSGNFLAIRSGDKNYVYIYNITNGSLISTIYDPDGANGPRPSFIDDTSILLTGNNTVHLFRSSNNWVSSTLASTFPSTSSPVEYNWGVGFGGNGKGTAGSGDYIAISNSYEDVSSILNTGAVYTYFWDSSSYQAVTSNPYTFTTSITQSYDGTPATSRDVYTTNITTKEIISVFDYSFDYGSISPPVGNFFGPVGTTLNYLDFQEKFFIKNAPIYLSGLTDSKAELFLPLADGVNAAPALTQSFNTVSISSVFDYSFDYGSISPPVGNFFGPVGTTLNYLEFQEKFFVYNDTPGSYPTAPGANTQTFTTTTISTGRDMSVYVYEFDPVTTETIFIDTPPSNFSTTINFGRSIYPNIVVNNDLLSNSSRISNPEVVSFITLDSGAARELETEIFAIENIVTAREILDYTLRTTLTAEAYITATQIELLSYVQNKDGDAYLVSSEELPPEGGIAFFGDFEVVISF